MTNQRNPREKPAVAKRCRARCRATSFSDALKELRSHYSRLSRCVRA